MKKSKKVKKPAGQVIFERILRKVKYLTQCEPKLVYKRTDILHAVDIALGDYWDVDKDGNLKVLYRIEVESETMPRKKKR